MSKFWQKKYISKHTGAEIDEAVEAVLDGDVGTTVIANPTLAGTEAALTGLQVDETKYSVGGMSQAEADQRYLQLSGGTMTGDITLTSKSIKSGTNVIFEAGNGQTMQPTLGSAYIDKNLRLMTKSGRSIIHGTDDGNMEMLDTGNTAANPTLAGTEAALTGIKIAGTDYSVGSPLYWHTVQLVNEDATNGFNSYILILSTDGTAFTKTTLRNFFKSNTNARFITVSGTGTGSGNTGAHLSYASYFTDDQFRLYMYLTGATAESNITVSWASNDVHVNDNAITRIM